MGKTPFPLSWKKQVCLKKTSRSIPPTHVEASPSFTKWHTARQTVPAPAQPKDGWMDDGCTVVSGNHGPCIVYSCSRGHFTASSSKILQVQRAATLPIQHNQETRSCRQPPVDTMSVTRTISLRLNHAAISSRYHPIPFQARNLPRITPTPRPCPSDINPR